MGSVNSCSGAGHTETDSTEISPGRISLSLLPPVMKQQRPPRWNASLSRQHARLFLCRAFVRRQDLSPMVNSHQQTPVEPPCCPCVCPLCRLNSGAVSKPRVGPGVEGMEPDSWQRQQRSSQSWRDSPGTFARGPDAESGFCPPRQPAHTPQCAGHRGGAGRLRLSVQQRGLCTLEDVFSLKPRNENTSLQGHLIAYLCKPEKDNTFSPHL